MKTNKSGLDSYWLQNLNQPVVFVETETEQSEVFFSIDVETAKNMASGTCILPSGSRDYIVCKDEENIKIFKIIRQKNVAENIEICVSEPFQGEK